MGFLIISLLFIHSPAFPQSPDTFNCEKDYHRFVDSKKPLSVLKDKDIQLHQSYLKVMSSHMLTPSQTIKYGPGNLQALDIYTHQGRKPAPVIFFIHSGSSDTSEVQYAVRSWLSLGYTVVSINYRSIPENKFSEQLGDCFLALKWVADNIGKYGGDGNRIAITGVSVGAYMSAILVTETKWQKRYNIDMQKVKCWILISGFYSAELKDNYLSPTIADYLKIIRDQAKNDASPIEHITGKEPPSLIIHGRNDWAVPRTNATNLYKKLKESGSVTQLEMLNGCYHISTFSGYNTPGHIPTILINKFLAKYLPTKENH
jgi:acetyl esterase/lipase